MKKFLTISIIGLLILATACTKQPYYEIPKNADGNVVITGVSKATSDGITTLDNSFTVNATLPNAKEGDKMKVELLKIQTSQQGGNEQLLPLAGTQKEVTVGSDLKVSVSYTRQEAQLQEAGDYVLVTFAGKTESAQLRINMEAAMAVSSPQFQGTDVDVIRSAGTAFFNVTVIPQSGNYSGNVVVKRKNGMNDAWQNIGSFTAPAKVPVSGNDFAAGKDTMYYSFSANQGTFTDEIITSVVVNDSYFFVKRTGMLSLTNADKGGMNLLDGMVVPAGDGNAVVAAGGGSSVIKGGIAWAVGGKSISFVPTTSAMYDMNSVSAAITAYQGGSPVMTADPLNGDGVFVFKMVNGSGADNVFYGLLKITNVVPGVSVEYEYRIGNIYAHLPVIK